MKRKTIIGVGIIGLLLGTMMILPALGKHKQRNQATLSAGADYFRTAWAHDEVYGLLWGTGLFIVGAGTGIYGFQKRKA